MRLYNGSIKCWGYAKEGQLGSGATTNIGDAGGEMGYALPAVDLRTGRTADKLSVRGFYSRLDDRSTKCWGQGNYGELGIGTTQNMGDQPEEMGDFLPAVDFGTGRTAVEVVVGGGHSCAILDDDSTKCWGYNAWGQLGLGDTANKGDDSNEMGDNLPAVDLGTGRKAVELALGGETQLCKTRRQLNQVLGLQWSRATGNWKQGVNLQTVDFATGRTATRLAAGQSHTCARLDDGSIKCFGWNGNGQLGIESSHNMGDNGDEMGNYLPAVDLGTGGALLSK